MNSVVVIILSFLFFVLPYKTCQLLSLENSQISEFVPLVDEEGSDPGTPLFLTPLIEEGRIDEAQTRAAVRHHEMGDIKSYSGYLTVNKEYNSNLFFWFFPAFITPNMAPVVLWLQRKPGLTSMFGLFEENGPFDITVNGTLEMRRYTLNWHHNVIYIDSPVGAGYSFTDNEKGYSKNFTQVAKDLHTALVQFFLLFPDLQTNDFFVTGEGYAGKYATAVAHAIKDNNEKVETKINLKGLAIGNGLCDPENQLVFSDYLYQIGLIDRNEKAKFQTYEQAIHELIKQKNFVKALENFDKLFSDNDTSLFYNLTGLKQYYNFVHANMHYDNYLYYTELIEVWIQKVDARRAIHVGNNTFNLFNGTVSQYQEEDMFKSVVVLLIDLLEHYRVLIYNGQLDILNAYPLTENYLQKMKWSGAEKFASAPRKFWRVGRDLTGFTKSADNLKFVLVRNAGNMVFIDQPQWAVDLITRFTHFNVLDLNIF